MDGCWPGYALKCDIVMGAVCPGGTLISVWGEHNGLLALSPTRKGMDDLVEGALVRAVFSSWSMLLGPMWLILGSASLTTQNLVKFQDILWNLKRA